MQNKKLCIIGNGAWGRAMYHVLSQNTSSVRLVGKGERVTEEIVVIAVPTNNIRELASVIQPSGKELVIINTAKGIEQNTYKLPHEVISELFPKSRYFTLIGPGFAGEVVKDMPTIVNLGYGKRKDEGYEFVNLFQTKTFRVRPCEAIHTLELSAALKNIYAIGCGLVDGLGYEINTRVLLTVIAIEEIQQLFENLGIGIGPKSIPGTIGDLVLTCNSIESRNFQFGRNLASFSVKESLKKVKEAVEGYSTLQSLHRLEKTSGVKLPLAEFIKHVVHEDNTKTVKKRFEKFITTT